MFRYRMRFITVSAAALLLATSSVFAAQTWRLGKGQDWKAVSAKAQDEYLLAVAEIKKLVNAAECDRVRKALAELKKNFQEIAGPDLDAFTEAEILFCKGNFTKAAKRYDKFLSEYPESKLYEAALDRQFAIATAFLAGQKRPILKVFKMKGYSEGAKIMERIGDRAGDAPIGVKAAIAVAKSLETRGKFDEAYHKWSEVSSRWPMGQTAKDALLGMARCKHAAYEGPKYDASSLISAKSYYENFRLRYPQDAEEIGVDDRLKQINEQLAYKQLDIGRYYQKTGNKQSANFYYQMVIDNWPESTAAKMAKDLMSGEDLPGKKVKK